MIKYLSAMNSGIVDAKGENRLLIFGLSFYILFVSASLYLLFGHWAYDDPFISYRYARNLSEGLGFVYNPGERVLSTTTPLFTLLLASLYPFSADLPRIAILAGSFSLALGGFFLWDLAKSWNSPLVGWIALFVYPTFSLLPSTLGSETPLYLALCLGAFAFYARRNYQLTAAFGALAVLARPDGILVPLLLASHYLLYIRGKIPWKALIVFLGLTSVWFAFAWIYFGSPIPVTLGAKQGQGTMAISQRFASGFLTILEPYTKKIYFWIEVPLALLGIYTVARRKRQWAFFLLWPVIYSVSYSALGVTRYFWYYAPLVPGFVIAVGLGIETVAYSRFTQKSVKLIKRNGFLGLLPILLIGCIFLFQGFDLFDLRHYSDNRFLAYRAVGDWLDKHTPHEATVGALEVGIIGYYSHRSMVDFAGLIQPKISAQFNRDTNYEEVAIWAANYYRPDFLVVHDRIFGRLEKDYAEKHCTLAQHFSGAEYGYPNDLSIFSCN
jgi:hypothetical protein